MVRALFVCKSILKLFIDTCAVRIAKILLCWAIRTRRGKRDKFYKNCVDPVLEMSLWSFIIKLASNNFIPFQIF